MSLYGKFLSHHGVFHPWLVAIGSGMSHFLFLSEVVYQALLFVNIQSVDYPSLVSEGTVQV